MLHALNLVVKRFLILALAAASCAIPLQSATLERLSLDDMIRKSTMIVRGKVTASWPALTGSIIYTHYKIQVSESFKGLDFSSPDKPGVPQGALAGKDVVEIMVPGGTVNGRQQNFSGSPVLSPGDEFVFFLWTSTRGVTWITGLTQGLFALPAGDSSTDRAATRTASRELMLDAATSRAVKDSALSMRLGELRTRIATTLAAPGGAK